MKINEAADREMERELDLRAEMSIYCKRLNKTNREIKK